MEQVLKVEGPVTVYKKGDIMGNYNRHECRSIEVNRGPYAQYTNAYEFRVIKKGQRKVKGWAETHNPRVIVLQGRGLPCAEGRHSGFSPKWDSDFNAKIDTHIATSGTKVLLDTRGQSCR